MDDPQKPARYAYWAIGRVGPTYTVNVAAGKVGIKPEGQATMNRPAAESIGRAGYAGGADALVAALKAEADAHARGDELLALAKVKDPRAPELGRQFLSHKDAWVRRQALGAVADLDAAETGLKDPDLRVRGEAIRLVGRLDPKRAVREAKEAFERAGRGRELWAEAVALSDAVFAEYVQQQMPGGDALLLAVAARRANRRIANALTERLQALANQAPAAFASVAICQRDKPLARALFAKRANLPKAVSDHLTLILENAFEARLGDVADDWAEWLAAN